MPQHVKETGGVGDGTWLPLTEYAVRSGISLSTIRRKIKNNSIQHRLEKGRYLILFRSDEVESLLPEISEEIDVKPHVAPPPSTKEESMVEDKSWGLPIVQSAVKILNDAFERTLKEKDERIKLLEKRNAELEANLTELRTLVRILEEKYEVRY